jgi:hypothetical protein
VPVLCSGTPLSRILPIVLLLPLALGGCGEAEPPDDETGLSPEQEVFWTNLEALCGAAFVGEPLEAPSDSDWRESELVMHVRDEIRIPLHVDDDRARTWVVTRTDTGLRPNHDHRLEDGSPDTTNTDCGGDTAERGSEIRQEFPADGELHRLAPLHRDPPAPTHPEGVGPFREFRPRVPTGG